MKANKGQLTSQWANQIGAQFKELHHIVIENLRGAGRFLFDDRWLILGSLFEASEVE